MLELRLDGTMFDGNVSQIENSLWSLTHPTTLPTSQFSSGTPLSKLDSPSEETSLASLQSYDRKF